MESMGPEKVSSMLHFSQYADDTIIFCKATIQQLNIVKFVLYIYELLTGLKINFTKSYIVGLGINNCQAKACAAIPGCKTSTFPINYLGIPLHSKSLSARHQNFMVNKMERKL